MKGPSCQNTNHFEELYHARVQILKCTYPFVQFNFLFMTIRSYANIYTFILHCSPAGVGFAQTRPNYLALPRLGSASLL